MFHTIFPLRCLPPVEVAKSPRRTSDFGHRTSDSAWSRSGSALVIVLGMLSVLLLMGVAFSVTMRTERAAAANMRHAAVARHILDSAIARTMADLDRALEDQGDLPVPTGGVIVTVSQQPGGEASVNPLSPEAALHIPADQLVAAVFTNAQWLPIYGDVRINGNTANDPVRGDSPVGRYAFVVLNGCGYLDPNVVGASNRLYGLSPCEIDIAGDGDRVLGITGAGKADKFLDERDSEGHFVTMRDFLRPTITNLLGYKPMNIDGANLRFPTNSFFVGSLALDDLAPPTDVQKVGKGDAARYYPVRKPKFALRDPDTGELKTASRLKDDPAFLDAMTNSFLATWAGQKKNEQGNLPRNFLDPFSQSKRFDYSLLAARNLLDMMDEDSSPGGSKKHSLSSVGQQNSGNEDEYLAAFGVHNWNWDRLPCVEPVPMLDNLIICGGYDPGLSINPTGGMTPCLTWDAVRLPPPDPTDPNSKGNVTGIVCTVTLSLCASSDIYLGWNVPKGADGTFTYNWRFTGAEADEPADGYPDTFQPFIDAMQNLSFAGGDHLTTINLVRDANGKPEQMRAPSDFLKLPPIKFCLRVGPKDVSPNPGIPSISEEDLPTYIPDDFGFVLHAVGIMGRGDQNGYENDVVQVVPCQQNTISQASGDSVLDVYLPINRAEALTKTTTDYVLGATYAIDPRFAYKKMSWIWTPGLAENTGGLEGESDYKLRKSLVRGTLDNLEVLSGGDINPMTDKYLRDPHSVFSVFIDMGDPGQMVDGGVSDVMRSSPRQGFYNISTSQANTAVGKGALSFYFDPEASEDSPWAFTRVGQLGFVPIGTYRTIALMDGFDNTDNTPHVEVRQRVLDYFTMNPPRDEGSSGSDSNPGDPVKTELFTSRVGINPPRFPEVNSDNEVVPGDYNLLPLTAAFNGCPLREWDSSSDTVDWDMAATLAENIADSLDRDDEGVRNVDKISKWEDEFDDAEGVTRSLSVLGRSVYDSDAEQCVSIDAILHNEFPSSCDFEREGVIRNTAEMLTTRQQLFTILLKADSYTPMSGFSDASHGMSLASVQVIAHIWRDPEPLRDADGKVILDNPNKPDEGHPIHAWMLLDMYQF